LMNLRLNFVQTVESPSSPAEKQTSGAETPSETSHPAGPVESTMGADSTPNQDDEHRKKFSKKY
jgi:hypothetical protein